MRGMDENQPTASRTAHDLTPAVDLTLHHGSGPFRTRLPHYVSLKPPCNHACPAGEDIQTWLAFAQAGEYRRAWETLIADNPLPATHGRVCYHPCETACNRGELDGAVSIHAVERFLGDMALDDGWTVPVERATGKRILVIGAGPSGLSAAYHLTRLGHQVQIHEAGPLPGGMLHFGIPAYRLPRTGLLAEIARIRRMGVHIELSHHLPIHHHRVPLELDSRHRAKAIAVTVLAEDQHHGVGFQSLQLAGRLRPALVVERHPLDRQRWSDNLLDRCLLAERDAGRFDAVFVAIGAHVGKHVDIPARGARPGCGGAAA